MEGWDRGKNSPLDPLPEKNLIATKTDRRAGKFSFCLTSSIQNLLKISDNIFIRF